MYLLRLNTMQLLYSISIFKFYEGNKLSSIIYFGFSVYISSFYYHSMITLYQILLATILFFPDSAVAFTSRTTCPPSANILCGHPPKHTNLTVQLTLIFNLLSWKLARQLFLTRVKVNTNFGFSALFCFRVRSPYWTERQTRPVLWPNRRPHSMITDDDDDDDGHT